MPVPVDVSETRLQPRPGGGRGRGHAADARSCFPCTSTASWPTCARSSSSPARHELVIVEDACQAHGADARRDPRRRGRTCGRLQLLPEQEPRRVRRRRRARHRRRRARRAPCARCASTASARSTGTSSRATRRASTRSRRSCCSHKLPLLDGWNERAAAQARVLHRARSTASATSRSRRSRPSSEPVWHLYSSGPATRSASRASSRARHRDRPALPGAARTSRPRTGTSATGGQLPGRRGDSPRVPVAADLPGHERGAARGGRRTAVAAFFRDGA